MNENTWNDFINKVDEREKMDRLLEAILASGMSAEEVAERLGIELI